MKSKKEKEKRVKGSVKREGREGGRPSMHLLPFYFSLFPSSFSCLGVKKDLLPMVLLLALALVGCGRGRKPNVILVVMDTTRADHLSCYGYPHATSPILDSLARESVLFKRAASPAPATLPAVTSILTGLYPYHHGVRYNNCYRLSRDVPLVSEAFRRRGYHAGAFISAYVLHSSFGLARGFERYDERFDKARQNLVGLNAVSGAERKAGSTTSAALEWLAQARQPFFLLLHYFDPHFPYQPPSMYEDKFSDPYDGEIAYVDLNLGRLLSFLRQEGMLENTLFVVTADHGEGLGEHGEETHAFCQYGTTLDVPLMIRFPGGEYGGRQVGSLVRLMDIAPTLLDYAGLKAEAPMDGESLLPLLKDDRPGNLPCYAEAVAPYVEFRWPMIFSLNTGRYKLILKKRPELYDLYYDPGEHRDLAAEKQELVAEMSAAIRGFYASAPGAVSGPARLSSDEKRRLLSLGYLSGGKAPSLQGKMFDFYLENNEKLSDVRLLARRREEVLYAEKVEVLDGALADIRELDRRNPGAPCVISALGFAYLRRKQLGEAAAAFYRLSEVPEMELDAMEKLAYIHLALGNWLGAERCFERLLRGGYDHAEIHQALGEIYRRTGRARQAEEMDGRARGEAAKRRRGEQ